MQLYDGDRTLTRQDYVRQAFSHEDDGEEVRYYLTLGKEDAVSQARQIPRVRKPSMKTMLMASLGLDR